VGSISQERCKHAPGAFRGSSNSGGTMLRRPAEPLVIVLWPALFFRRRNIGAARRSLGYHSDLSERYDPQLEHNPTTAAAREIAVNLFQEISST
jgi:hypothetical protein